MPVQSISVADVLNGESNSFSYSENLESSISFVAPDAHVLVVDDVDTNLNVAKGLLSLYEVQTTLCNSGVEAIETLASRKFDFVLMDHMMPEMDGIETTKRIRAMGDSDPYFKNLPIIALTANAVVGTRELFLANGFDDFLSKPVDMAKLNATLAKWTPREKQNKPNLKTPLKSSTGLGLTIGGLDDRKGIANTGGTVEGFIKTLNVFVSDGQKKAEEIKACLVKGDLNLYTIYVHALKSSAACIGADKLSAGAEALEAAGNAKDMGFIQEYTSKLLTDLECLIANINNTLGFGLGAGDSTIESAELVQGLSGLKVAIEGMDLRGIRVATRNLDPYCSNPKIGADVKTILSNTLVGDYDHAISLIDTLLSGFQSMLKLK
ncbi:MAG: response regulator [Holophagaceae bacterium]|nr:response regulator [Holophagaceae bacterium]